MWGKLPTEAIPVVLTFLPKFCRTITMSVFHARSSLELGWSCREDLNTRDWLVSRVKHCQHRSRTNFISSGVVQRIVSFIQYHCCFFAFLISDWFLVPCLKLEVQGKGQEHHSPCGWWLWLIQIRQPKQISWFKWTFWWGTNYTRKYITGLALILDELYVYWFKNIFFFLIVT